jgi:hypothetical protein
MYFWLMGRTLVTSLPPLNLPLHPHRHHLERSPAKPVWAPRTVAAGWLSGDVAAFCWREPRGSGRAALWLHGCLWRSGPGGSFPLGRSCHKVANRFRRLSSPIGVIAWA